LQPSLTLRGGMVFAVDRPGSAAETGLETSVLWVPLRIEAEISPWASSAVTTSLGLRLGVDYVRVGTRALDGYTRAAAPVERAQPMVGMHAGVAWYVAPRVALTADAALDLDVSPRAYVVDEGALHPRVFGTSRLRPELALGVRFDITEGRAP
jgi:hypothetical protein